MRNIICMPFGRYKGKTVEELPLPYCRWLIKENVLNKVNQLKFKAQIQDKLLKNNIFVGVK